MRRQLAVRLAALAVVLAAGVVSARAQTFIRGDSEYEVTGSNNDEVSLIDFLGSGGHISIREFVEYEGRTFKVTSIGRSAFYGCTGLVSIDIPDCVTSIGDYAFYYCTGLTSVDFGEGLDSIGSYAFSDCTSLTSVDFPTSLTSIGEYAFRGCTGLTSIGFPAGLESIGEYAFQGCTSLTSIDFPAGLESIGEWAFSGCTGLTSIGFPAGLESIGYSAFYGCTGLTSIDIPDGVTSIGEWAFSGCTGLTSIELPDSLKTLQGATFANCTGLKSIKFPDKLKGINSGISGSYDFCGAFSGCTGLTSIDLPAGLTYISGFDGCTGLTSIEIPDGVTSIGFGAFSGCTGLTSVDFPAGLGGIREYAFSGFTGLTSVDFPAGLGDIGEYAFSGFTGLVSIELPEFGLGRIEESAFEGCTGLTSIEFPGSMTRIGEYAFRGCTGLTSIVSALGSYCSVGRDAFYNTDIRCAVLLSNSLARVIPFSAGSEVFAFGDEEVPYLGCDKLYTFNSKSCSSLDEPVRLGLGDLAYTGKPQGLSIEGNTSAAEMELLIESAVDAGTYTVGEVAFSFRYDEYGIDIPEVRAKKATYTIRKAPLDVSVSPSSAAITYGEGCPEFKVEYDGFVNGEGEEVLSSLPTVACEGNLDVGTHSVTASGGEAKNYDFNYIPGELTVNKATLAVAGESYTVTYGDELPEFGYEISGFVLGEDESVLDALPVVHPLFSPSGGEHTLDISGGAAKNYGFDYIPGTLTVLKASQSIEWSQNLTTGLVTGDLVELRAVASSGLAVSYESSDESVVRIEEYDGKAYAKCVGVGSANITAFQSGDRNYDFAPSVTKRVNVGHGSGLHDAPRAYIKGRHKPRPAEIRRGRGFAFPARPRQSYATTS